MTDHPNVAAARGAYEAFSAGDTTALANRLADDVIWHTIGGDTMNGASAVAESMSGLAEYDVSLSVHDVVGNDDHVVALVAVTVQTEDGPFSYRTAEIYHMADGKVTERWSFSDDTQAVVDFFS